MFQEYLGSGIIIVIWQLITMIVGLLIFSRYLMCLLARELDSGMLESDEIPSDSDSVNNNTLERMLEDEKA